MPIDVYVFFSELGKFLSAAALGFLIIIIFVAFCEWSRRQTRD